MIEESGRVASPNRLSSQAIEPPSSGSLDPAGVDPARGATILPVIHYADLAQALRNAERAGEAGCDGVILIEMRGRNLVLPYAAREIKSRWPTLLVGMNFLNTSASSELAEQIASGMDATWTDDQLTHSADEPWMEARRVQKALARNPDHLMFCGVAFKYQAHEPDPAEAARRAAGFGFIPTTSGPGTGEAADPAAVALIREAIGADAPLAIASGITPDNAHRFLPLVSHVLVSTGVSASFYEFDPAKLRALTALRDRDASLAEDAKRLSGEAVAARAEGIAHTELEP